MAFSIESQLLTEAKRDYLLGDTKDLLEYGAKEIVRLQRERDFWKMMYEKTSIEYQVIAEQYYNEGVHDERERWRTR